ncbi:MAG: hypothetical protein ACTSV1_00805 [Alphaproteobacteria bacterium]
MISRQEKPGIKNRIIKALEYLESDSRRHGYRLAGDIIHTAIRLVAEEKNLESMKS